MNTRISICIALIVALSGCGQPDAPPDAAPDSYDFDLQGHRGARGLLPENSIPGFLLAVDQGVDTVELDVVVSSDAQVVVSHEPWMSHEICSHPDGSAVTEEDAPETNLFLMPYSTISSFDCGSRGNPRFESQVPLATNKPLLSEALSAVDAHSTRPVRFNVEIKARTDGDGVYHPAMDAFAALVYHVVRNAGAVPRTTFQSFDPRALEAMYTLAPGATLALLVANEDGLAANLERLSFQPQIYSPNSNLVHAGLVDSLHALGMTVVPWTVNTREEMRSLLALGVDGIITDYPAYGAELKGALTQTP
ncbi:MAG: glycerophosphoryl diester phosphodiesterase [Thalassolituus oleivorans]|jgi:glycerophosphoryl diester phosphodiesterase